MLRSLIFFASLLRVIIRSEPPEVYQPLRSSVGVEPQPLISTVAVVRATLVSARTRKRMEPLGPITAEKSGLDPLNPLAAHCGGRQAAGPHGGVNAAGCGVW